MALNGLDAQALKDAFDFACSEPGWFCMKYASRDDIVLLGRGASAVKDMRELISREPDDSPIYGFIRYRRRNILIKLVPENTSRVLKARSQVHFQSVVERFSPCDVTVSLKTYRELTDAALTTACSTHTATASISSSSSSLRQRRLTDIQEASEEGFEGNPAEPKTESKVVGNQQGLQVIVTTHDPGISSDGTKAPIQVEISAPEPIKVEPEPEELEIPDALATDELERTRSNSLSRDEGGRRKSTSAASLRPSAADIYAELASIKYQPKVKLGPRPSADWNKRPHTASSSSSTPKDLSGQSSESLRPTASLPKNVYLPPRKARAGSSASSKLQFHESAPASPGPVPFKSKSSHSNAMGHPGPPPPLQFASTNNTLPNSFPPVPLSPTPSFASFKSTTSTFSLSSPIVAAVAAPAASSAGITPERARLMKALELRKKAMSQQSSTQTKSEEAGPPPPTESPSDTPTSSLPVPARSKETGHDVTGDELPAVLHASPEASAASTSPVIPSESLPLESSVPDTPTQDTYMPITVSNEQPAVETTIPSPTQAPSTSTEHDSQKSFSDDLDKESESSYGVSDANGDSIESNTITDDGNQDGFTTRLQPPPPTLLLPTPKTVSPEEPQGKEKLHQNIPKPLDLSGESVIQETSSSPNSPPRSPLLHLNMLAPKLPTSHLDTQQKLPKSHNRLPSTEVPVIETARSVSAPFMNNPQEKKPVLVSSSRKVNVSSGSVSQRIKQLEMLSKNKPTAQAALSPPRSRPSSPTPQFPPVRTNSLKTSSSSPNLSPLVGSSSGASTPQRLDSPFLNTTKREDLAPNGGKSYGLPLGGYPIATKARAGSIGEISIIPGRKPSITNLSLTPVNEPSPMEARKGSVSPIPSESSSPKDEKKSRIPPLLRRMSSSKTKKSPSPNPPATPVATPPAIPVAVAAPAPAQPAAPTEPEKKTLLTGWVNVQLPDTMLWKRRYLKVESDGWLFLTITEEEGSPQTGKFNVRSEGRSAVVPDFDEQELPNTVNITLKDSGVLACACQNHQEQSALLKVARSLIA